MKTQITILNARKNGSAFKLDEFDTNFYFADKSKNGLVYCKAYTKNGKRYLYQDKRLPGKTKVFLYSPE